MSTPTPTPSEDYTIHHRDPRTHALLHTYTLPRSLLLKKIPYYTALFTSTFGDSTNDSGNLFTDCVPSLTGVIAYCHSQPLPQNVAELVNTAVAADFLSAPDLLAACEQALEKQCHGFKCTCRSCADAVGPLLAAPDGVRKREVALLARVGCTEKLWKRPLVEAADGVLAEVVAKVRERIEREGSTEAVDRWVEVGRLRGRVQGSRIRSRWEGALICPVMEAVVERVTEALGDGVLAARMREAGFEKAAMEELVLRVASGVGMTSFRRVWRALGVMEEAEAVMSAREIVIGWARNWWISLAVDGFFADWTEEEREKLAVELGVAVDDLRGGGIGRAGSELRRRSGSETVVGSVRRRGGIETGRRRPISEIVVGMGRPGVVRRSGRGGTGGGN
jgi:hypothetical protein